MELASRMDIDLDDVESYPAAVYQEYREKKKHERYIERKEEKIKQIEDRFHDACQIRIEKLTKKRLAKGLAVKGTSLA